MCMKMTERDFELALEVFRACLPRVGAKAKNDRLFLEALHYFTLHNISWRALPERFGNWNSVWKRFDRLGKAGVFEDYLSILAGLDEVYGDIGAVLPAGTAVGLMGGAAPDLDDFVENAKQGTGVSLSETLYIEVREGGQPVNPEHWFAGAPL